MDDDALDALLNRPFTELTADELMALKDAYTSSRMRALILIRFDAPTSMMSHRARPRKWGMGHAQGIGRSLPGHPVAAPAGGLMAAREDFPALVRG